MFFFSINIESTPHSSYTKCPARTHGKYPNCKCLPPFTGTPPNCQAPQYLPPIKESCPSGFYGNFPNCIEPCPPYQIGWVPFCEKVKCPPTYSGDFQPNCKPPQTSYCPKGLIGVYPKCYKPIKSKYRDCPEGLTGESPDDCYVPCPANTYGRPPDCKRIKCPTGWTGDFQPNCTIKATCPLGKPGIWPDCRDQYCPTNTVGQYPNCRCAPGLFGTPPNCTKNNNNYGSYLSQLGYLPPVTTTENNYLGYLPPVSIATTATTSKTTTTENSILGYLPPKTENPILGYLPPKNNDSNIGLLPPNQDSLNLDIILLPPNL